MTETKVTIQEFLADLSPFNRLSTAARARLSQQVQPLRYRMGQVILKKEILPAQIIIIYQGQARFLAYDPRTQAPITLKLLKSGEASTRVGTVPAGLMSR